MVKKKKKRTPAIVRSELLLTNMDQPVLIRESYSTIKRRLRDSDLFVEVTDQRGIKSLFNKTLVGGVLPRV